jgi:hypothetical protein
LPYTDQTIPRTTSHQIHGQTCFKANLWFHARFLQPYSSPPHNVASSALLSPYLAICYPGSPITKDPCDNGFSFQPQESRDSQDQAQLHLLHRHFLPGLSSPSPYDHVPAFLFRCSHDCQQDALATSLVTHGCLDLRNNLLNSDPVIGTVWCLDPILPLTNEQ